MLLRPVRLLNPTYLPSGDQKGWVAPSVPASVSMAVDPSDRTTNLPLNALPVAATMNRPSGETASNPGVPAKGSKRVGSSGMSKLTARGGMARALLTLHAAVAPRARKTTAAAAIRHRPRSPDGVAGV